MSSPVVENFICEIGLSTLLNFISEKYISVRKKKQFLFLRFIKILKEFLQPEKLNAD